MDGSKILKQLESHLERLTKDGVTFLNLAPQPLGPAAEAPAATLVPGTTVVPGAPVVPGAASPAAATDLAEGLPLENPPAADPGGVRMADLRSLEELRACFHDCQACKLAPTRTNLVFGVGDPEPGLLFIGEGPGAEEDAQGEPFVGRAGALLTGLIKAVGLTREDVYITNVVKCRPPGNRNPEPDEIAACRPILQRQIELMNPRLIVTLGNVPLKLLRPTAAGITRERGNTFSYGSWSVLPTFHPSYLLRNPTALETCWLDFKKAFQIVYGS